METVSAILAEQFSRIGLDITVVTSTLGEQVGGSVSDGYRVVRSPSVGELRRLAKDSDLIFQNNISLKTLLPVLLMGKPIVVAHHTWISRVDGKQGWQDRLKRFIVRRCHNIAISQAIAADLPVSSTVAGNPFEAEEFFAFHDAPRSRDVIFVGRLVSDKGCDLLLRAVAILKQRGERVSLTVMGDGPEMPNLKAQARELGIEDQVDFLGSVRENRAREVAKHAVMAIPSRWAEPFGVVALEGLAAGCAVIAADVGGLPEAVGPAGVLFPREDPAALAGAISEMLAAPELRARIQQQSRQHLENFKPAIVAQKYVKVFRAAIAGAAAK
ncbi:MAG TPA: glycosyltransferase family 4 protein [Acidobacteriaceae bacterium]